MLGRGFSARCKSLMRATRTRIGVIWRKRNAVEKFLKEDIADLLANGLDVNAYGRAEGLLVELTVSSCYIYIELCCMFLLSQLSSMQKTSDCPENCREPLSSLMFAAARFSDLPELRKLRQVLKQRYGNSLDHFVNREFAERMKAKPSAMERKIEIMQGIASEFSTYWDSKAFEQRMSMPPSILQDQLKRYGTSPHGNHKAEIFGNKATLWQRFVEADDNNLPSNNETIGFIGYKGNPDHHPTAELSGNLHDESNAESLGILAKIESGEAEPKEFFIFAYDGSWREVNTFQMGISGCSYCGKSHEGKVGRSNRRTRRKNYLSKRDSNSDTSPCRNEAPEMPRYQNGVNPSYIQLDSKPPKERDYKEANGHHEILHEGQSPDSVTDELEVAPHPPIDTEKDVKPVKTTLDGHDEEFVRRDAASGHFLSGPKSVRSRSSKLRPIFDDSSYEVAYLGKRTSRSSPRSEEAKKGLRVTFDDVRNQCDAEERFIDRLLLHYSKKPSTYEPRRLRRKHGSHHGHQIETDLSKHEEEDPEVRPPCPPLRSISLPPEQTTAAEMPPKAMIRAASLPPGSSSRARHVHPKLPEYDDLVARLASLRGT